MFFKRKSRRLRQNLKNFKRKSVDVAKFVKDFYIDEGLAYISCNVSDYYDVIDKFSVPGYEWLDQSFARFVEENANYIPPEYPIVLSICGTKFNEAQQECIEKTIADYYALKMGDCQMAEQRNRFKIIVLLVLVAVISALMWLSTTMKLVSPLSEAIYVLFWFGLWDMVEFIVFEGPDLREEKHAATQLATMKVTFPVVYDYEPFKPEEEAKIIEEVFEDDVILPSTQW